MKSWCLVYGVHGWLATEKKRLSSYGTRALFPKTSSGAIRCNHRI
ncbi:hypothetical protein DA2_3820 [Desulfovibrio sp. A2]|nr:hypothetical protein DA2_3820 [Desulfovibrio sp. A2]